MARVLVPLPDRDFDVTEVAVPWKLLRRAGHEVVFATEAGAIPACDPLLLTGVLFGKHPMVPAISPKKSWEGFAGSLTAGTAMAVEFSPLGPVPGIADGLEVMEVREGSLAKTLGIEPGDVLREINGKPPLERQRVRQERSRPRVEALETWLRAQYDRLSPNSQVAKAIAYSLNRWDGLARFLDYVQKHENVWVTGRLDIAKHWAKTHPFQPA